MDNIIKQIRKIIGEHNSSWITIHIANDEIWMDIYESDVPLVINLKKEEVYVDCESAKHHLCADMLNELSQICRLLEDNIYVIKDLLNI